MKSKGEAEGIKDFDIILNDRYIDGIYIDGAVAVSIIFFAIFIMFASSFVIYSIFYISIVNSMPMYARFISLGTTKKQLRYFLKMQGNLLALRFIPLGAVISIFIVVILSGVRWILYDLAIVLLYGFLFSSVIKFALRKPAKLLAKTSPIEAMKFQGEKAGLALKFILFELNIFPILLFSILLVGLQVCISYGVSRSIEKDTLVERLRTE